MMTILGIRFFGLLLLSVVPVKGQNAVIPCRQMFVSSATVDNGRLNAKDADPIASVDQLCTSLAMQSTLATKTGVWQAFLGTSTVSGVDHVNLQASDCFVDVRDRRIANSTRLLLIPSSRTYIELDENGESRVGSQAWTGMNDDGTISPHTCNDWTSTSVAHFGQRGYVANSVQAQQSSNSWLEKQPTSVSNGFDFVLKTSKNS
jgi:hypothetical protein